MAGDQGACARRPAVLVLDDEKDVQAIVRMILARHGVACDAVSSLSEAREAMAARRYDILVADINVADGSGLSLLEPGPEAPRVLLMTGSAPSVAAKLAPDGTWELLAKPFHVSEFLERFGALEARWKKQLHFCCR